MSAQLTRERNGQNQRTQASPRAIVFTTLEGESATDRLVLFHRIQNRLAGGSRRLVG